MRVVAILLMAAVTAACNPRQESHPLPRNDRTRDAAPLEPQDRDFLEKAAQGNQAEYAAGGLAAHRTRNASVIAYGRMMVAEHGNANVRLGLIARERRIAIPHSLGEQQQSYDRLVDLRDAAFDAEFARVMVEDHQVALRVYQAEVTGGSDPLLRNYAASMVPRIEAHLAQAKLLLPLEDAVTHDDRHSDPP